MRDEIWAGLKNAIERGSSLDEAVQSFISAGYNSIEVKEAAKNISQGAASIVGNQLPEQRVNQKITVKQNLQNDSSQERKEVENINKLPSVEFSKDNLETTDKNELNKTSSPQMVYVPGAQNSSQQSIPATANVQKTSVGYIPLNGANSTRKKKIIILVIFLVFFICLITLGVLYYEQILKFLKTFYETSQN